VEQLRQGGGQHARPTETFELQGDPSSAGGPAASEVEFIKKRKYIRENPVKGRLSHVAKDWEAMYEYTQMNHDAC
jgi:hypothetical protein